MRGNLKLCMRLVVLNLLEQIPLVFLKSKVLYNF